MAGRGKVLVAWRCCRLGPKTDFSVGREAAESEVQLPWERRGSEARSQVGDGDSLPSSLPVQYSSALGICRTQTVLILVNMD